MNPFEHWYHSNEGLREFARGHYEKHIDMLDAFKELKRDCGTLFRTGSFLEKTQVLTLLEAYKMHFG